MVDPAFIVESVICAGLAVVVGALNVLSIHRARNAPPLGTGGGGAAASPSPDGAVLVLIKRTAPSANSPLSPVHGSANTAPSASPWAGASTTYNLPV